MPHFIAAGSAGRPSIVDSVVLSECDAVSVSDRAIDPDQPLRRAEFLFLAGRDFWDVGIGVDHLIENPQPDGLATRVRIIFETGLLMLYCRPFSGSGNRQISRDPELSNELRTFHDDVMNRRNKVYAHTDHTDHRLIRDFRSATGLEVLHNFENSQVREEWDSLTDQGLMSLRELASIHHRRVTGEMERIRARLPRGEEP